MVHLLQLVSQFDTLTKVHDLHRVSSCMGFPGSSVGKECACNAGDPGSIPGSGRSPGEGIGYPLQYSWASLVAQLVKSASDAGDLGWIPALGRSLGGGHGNSLQCSCLENARDGGAWRAAVSGVAQSRRRLK